ncbi:DUF3795 domain-containing protein [Candidatus Stoquefichus sp. SB1]|uniref:DUF3795 domain-containing protein n=1 Tax=Candidatus Stoquefichus sp. SB1 TaxID=1658109 RepID=UPI00067F4032|nr:DUF3795 domain-containing protein [Candidatus Stoquefichus sp. SB1]
MKDFERINSLFSLCGLNCGLCSMKLSGHCGGCGFGNQSCKIAKCSLEHNKIEYCFQCEEYPCSKYESIELFDSFITHRNQKIDMLKAQKIGIEFYNAEQTEKSKLLNILLSNYNSGREKTLYCLAVNLFEVDEIKEVLAMTENNTYLCGKSVKEKADYVKKQLQALAEKNGVELKLRKK